VLPPSITYDTAAIGRVVIDADFRGKGIGKQLMQAAMEKIRTTWKSGATLSAQIQTIDFYERLGFMTVDEPYDEAFTPHIKMVCNPEISL